MMQSEQQMDSKSEHYVLSRALVGRRGRGGGGRAGVAVILNGACREML